MILNCAIDSGFSFCQGESKLTEVTIEAFIEEITELEALEVAENIQKIDKNNIILEYEKRYYAIGRQALLFNLNSTYRLSKDRTDNILHIIELLSVLGLLSDNDSFECNLGVALPNRYRFDRKSFEKNMKRKFEFSYLYKDGRVTKIIDVQNVVCIPQPYAPVYILPENKQSSLVLSIDIGFGTTDMLLIQNKEIVKGAGLIVSAEGMHQCFDILRDTLIAKYANTNYKITSFTDKKIQTIIETGKYFIEDQEQDIGKELNYAFDKFVSYVYEQAEKSYSAYLPDVQVFIASGGIINSPLFKEKLKNKFKSNFNRPFMSYGRPQYAVVDGIYYLVNNTFMDDMQQINDDAFEEVAADGGEDR